MIPRTQHKFRPDAPVGTLALALQQLVEIGDRQAGRAVAVGRNDPLPVRAELDMRDRSLAAPKYTHRPPEDEVQCPL